jgi:hypothetical protein
VNAGLVPKSDSTGFGFTFVSMAADNYALILNYLDELTAVDMECRASGISANTTALSVFLTTLQQYPAEEQIALLHNKIELLRNYITQDTCLQPTDERNSAPSSKSFSPSRGKRCSPSAPLDERPTKCKRGSTTAAAQRPSSVWNVPTFSQWCVESLRSENTGGRPDASQEQQRADGLANPDVPGVRVEPSFSSNCAAFSSNCASFSSNCAAIDRILAAADSVESESGCSPPGPH